MVKFLFRLFLVTLFLGLAGFTAILWVFWKWGQDLPPYHQLSRYEPPVATRVHAGNGALLAEFATQKRLFVPVKAMPPQLVHAFLSAEDKAFYQHPGVDPIALARAVVTNIAAMGTGRRPIGASTITQQVAKNFLLTNELSFDRKIKEAILAIRMERAFSKEQILALYLNEIYLGYGSYGVAAAALNYFDKALDKLDLHEMAYLAALPKAPSNYHPMRKTKAAIGRRNWVLKQMQENGYITTTEAADAQARPLGIRPPSGFDEVSAPYFTEEIRRLLVDRFGSDTLYGGGLSVRSTLDSVLQKKAERALREGLEALDRRQGWRGPLGRIDQAAELDAQLAEYTKALPDLRYAALVTEVSDDRARIYVNGQAATIPFELAKWAYPPRRADGVRPAPLASLKEALAIDDIVIVQPPAEAKDLLKEGYQPQPGEFALGQRPDVEGAIVVLDPHTGRMLSLVGGYDYRVSEFNRATQARRQPGSAFKPFVYLAALDKGYSPTTRILDAPLAVDQGQGKPKWKPANYTKQFYGPSIMRVGIEKSRNLMTARLAMAIGMPTVQEYAARFGIDKEMPPYLSMSLGAGETTLLQLTAAYGQLVNGGRKVDVSLIDRIQDRYGHTILRHDLRDCQACAAPDGWQNQPIPALAETREQLTDPASAYQMVSMLEGVVTRGTGRRIADSGLVLAGKTGTTNDNTNAWFIGFSPDLVVGVYVGYDVPRPLGKSETGSTAAVPIFKDFMMDALAQAPVIPFRRPGGISLVPVHAETGERVRHDDKMAVLEVFKPGQRPKSGILIDLPDDKPASGVDAPALY
ncbi:MAG: penicillin-binding protein 1A [Candidatus Puniceispirillaceae bacterium]